MNKPSWFCTRCLKPWGPANYRLCDDCRSRARAKHYGFTSNRVSTAEMDSPWWDRLSMLTVHPFEQTWSIRCPHCSSLLLSTENTGWCCSKGRRAVPKLPPYPETFEHWLDSTTIRISAVSRRLNGLFAFSAIGATEGFVQFRGFANVVVTGRVYHRLIDLLEGEHSMHWFLYDETSRSRKATDLRIPREAVDFVRHLLNTVNPYIHTVRHALNEVNSESIPVALELEHVPAEGELAAVINTQNLRTIDSRKIVFFRGGGRPPRFVNIFSRHYEPLQYPLLFPYGTPGWGRSPLSNSTLVSDPDATFDDSNDSSCCVTQIEWYRGLLVSEPRFLTFSRLTYEYTVDMYSRAEEARLLYLKFARSIQTSAFRDPSHPTPADVLQNQIPSSFIGCRAWASD
jgi:hypothetical protein